MRSARILALSALLLSAFIWGANTPIMKWSLGTVPLFSLAFLRFYLATLILFPFVLKSLKVQRKDYLKIILAALCGITFNVSFFFLGLKLTFAINAALIIATIPIFTIAAAQVFLKEKISGQLIIAVLIATFGLIAIVGPPVIKFGLAHFFGGFFLILASLFWVGYEILSKELFKKYPPQTVTFYSFLIGSLTFVPLFLWELSASPWLSNLKIQGLTGIIYGAIFSSTIAYLSWQYGLSKIAASEASFFFYLDPISGVIISVLLLKEKITPSFIFGGLLIILAVIMAEAKRRQHPLHKKFSNT